MYTEEVIVLVIGIVGVLVAPALILAPPLSARIRQGRARRKG